MAARPHDADEPEAVEPGTVGMPSGDVPSAADLPPAADLPSGDVPADDVAPATRSGDDPARAGGSRDAVTSGDEPQGPAGPVGATPEPRGAPVRPDRVEPLPDDVEARWLELVAQLEEPSDPVDEPEPGAPRAAPPADRVRVVRPSTPTGPRAWAPDPAVEEAEDHFEPPEPGPVLGGDPLLTMAWAAVVGVPALLLIAVVAWRDIPVVVLEAAGVAFLGAVGLLLWRMPHHRDDDSGPGAVV